MRNSKNTATKIVFTITSILLLGFIFTNSLLDASSSTVQSTGVLELIHKIFDSFNIEYRLSEHFVRKSAHFIEYFTLSISLVFMYSAYFLIKKKAILFTLLTGVLSACVDESIQMFSAGRSSQLSDVVLDSSAVLAVVIIFCLIFLVVKKKDDGEV